MPRQSIERPAARPTSPRQRERYQGIIRAVRTLTIDKGEDAVQMSEVAQHAGVALNTLYRYFPSKAHLYTAVLGNEIERLGEQFPLQSSVDDAQATANVLQLIDTATDALLSRPLLARAVMNATFASPASGSDEVARTDDLLQDALLAVLGIDEPTATDKRMCYMIMVSWSGVLTSVLNGRLDRAELEAMVRLSVEQLVLRRSNRTTAA